MSAPHSEHPGYAHGCRLKVMTLCLLDAGDERRVTRVNSTFCYETWR